jgi:hypothetical protein
MSKGKEGRNVKSWRDAKMWRRAVGIERKKGFISTST